MCLLVSPFITHGKHILFGINMLLLIYLSSICISDKSEKLWVVGEVLSDSYVNPPHPTMKASEVLNMLILHWSVVLPCF